MLTRLKLGTEAGGAAGRGPVGTASFFAGAELLKSSRRTALWFGYGVEDLEEHQERVAADGQRGQAGALGNTLGQLVWLEPDAFCHFDGRPW